MVLLAQAVLWSLIGQTLLCNLLNNSTLDGIKASSLETADIMIYDMVKLFVKKIYSVNN